MVYFRVARSEWSGPARAEAQVKGVQGAIHQGYSSLNEAKAAYQYARERGWIMVRPPSPANPSPPIPALPEPLQSLHISNPLHGSAASKPRWHVVYAGIRPGVYASYLECALNILGLRSSAYQSADSRKEAEQYWLAAVANDDVLRTLILCVAIAGASSIWNVPRLHLMPSVQHRLQRSTGRPA
ncbi:hypothetical protein C8F04DRAFT_1283752 [Mycena alexandri]|uniref:Ribonuclease H1 N-terminal domain-containing protein n=1 Tax=Mycena alexandri TaxID=1745969 RepID=A0AAD6WKU0_9AGAR|nr:hypothetical protein C8F04DRAFT_1283752 [Mycena alexandri]